MIYVCCVGLLHSQLSFVPLSRSHKAEGGYGWPYRTDGAAEEHVLVSKPPAAAGRTAVRRGVRLTVLFKNSRVCALVFPGERETCKGHKMSSSLRFPPVEAARSPPPRSHPRAPSRVPWAASRRSRLRGAASPSQFTTPTLNSQCYLFLNFM